MRRTFQPYLSKDAIRFVEAALLATHCEAFGGAARAIHGMLEESSRLTPSHVAAARVAAVQQPRPLPSLTAYSLPDLRHHAEFGLPLILPLSEAEESDDGDKNWEGLKAAVHATSPLDDPDHASCFAYVLVRLQGRPALFPVVITQVKGNAGSQRSATVFVMQDADILPEFIRTSAAMEGGVPDAWLVAGSTGPLASMPNFGTPEAPRLLTAGTPLVTYIDFIRRLMMLRTELQQELSRRDAKGVSMSGASSGECGKSDALWMKYFLQGQLPCQTHLQSLSASASNAVTGTGSGKSFIQSILKDVSDAAAFTSAQIEVLHSMSNNAVVPSPSPPGVLSNLRILEGTVGSGKSTMLVASGIMKGKLQAAARKEHQVSMQPLLKQATDAVKVLADRVEQAMQLSDLLGMEEAANSIRLDLPDELANAVENQFHEYERLSKGLQYCTTPLLLRPNATSDLRIVPSVFRFLSQTPARDGAPSILTTTTTTSLHRVVVETLQRSCNAPLARVLQKGLQELIRLGDLCAVLAADDADEMPLRAPLLSLVMSAREVNETCAAADDKGCPSWLGYLQEHLWCESDAVAAIPAPDEVTEWPSMQPSGGTVASVEMPQTTHLTTLPTDQAAGWRFMLWPCGCSNETCSGLPRRTAVSRQV